VGSMFASSVGLICFVSSYGHIGLVVTVLLTIAKSDDKYMNLTLLKQTDNIVLNLISCLDVYHHF
jgi:hypothetical protein